MSRSLTCLTASREVVEWGVEGTAAPNVALRSHSVMESLRKTPFTAPLARAGLSPILIQFPVQMEEEMAPRTRSSWPGMEVMAKHQRTLKF
jgi:hypothetical protein